MTRRKLVPLAVITSMVILGLGFVTPASGGQGPPQVQAAAPEVWEAYDNSRPLTGTTPAEFAFSLPAGIYVLTAKLTAGLTQSGIAAVGCTLEANSTGRRNWDVASLTLDVPSSLQTMAMTTTHPSSGAVAVTLTCSRSGTANVTLSYVKITATRVNAVTHIAL